jgi:hypothetical protein
MRTATLAAVVRGKVPLIALPALVGSDDWIRKATTTDAVLLGYAQSWALFRLLIQQHPKQFNQYLALVRSRRGPEHRLGDFVEVFGDVGKFEMHYQDFVQRIVREEARAAR